MEMKVEVPSNTSTVVPILQVHDKHNELPSNFREITEEEFAKGKFFSYYPESIEHRQCIIKDTKGRDVFHNLQIYNFFDGTGFALVNDYWAGKVRYFAFGCAHQYREMGGQECRDRNITHWGNCYHVYECEICKHVLAHDSSD